ncbi:MAG TPA: hypothetical protein VK893_08445, partial [Pyrinomonadaceae bacterium]|nr:hypothetical protein [Pyrinomonadaceae bacterium]
SPASLVFRASRSVQARRLRSRQRACSINQDKLGRVSAIQKIKQHLIISATAYGALPQESCLPGIAVSSTFKTKAAYGAKTQEVRDKKQKQKTDGLDVNAQNAITNGD